MTSSKFPDTIKKPRSEATAWCYTDTNDTDFSFAWTINNFSQKMKKENKNVYLDSNIFKVNVEGVETSWHLRCYPNNQESAKSVGVYLVFPSSKAYKADFSRHISYSLELVNQEKVGIIRHEGMFSVDEKNAKSDGIMRFVTHEKLLSAKNELLPEDSLELLCVMKIGGSEVNLCGTYGPTSTFPMDTKLAKDDWTGVMGLLETGELADIEVEVVCEDPSQTKTFNCHKAILGSRSSVFRATFVHNMKEKITGKITIKNMDLDIVESMLVHIYGGKIEGIEDQAEGLLAAAEQYELKQLKDFCEDFLAKSLNIGNCLDYMILADRQSAMRLKKLVIGFVVENFAEMVTQKNWKKMLASFPEVFCEIFNELASLHPSKIN